MILFQLKKASLPFAGVELKPSYSANPDMRNVTALRPGRSTSTVFAHSKQDRLK